MLLKIVSYFLQSPLFSPLFHLILVSPPLIHLLLVISCSLLPPPPIFSFPLLSIVFLLPRLPILNSFFSLYLALDSIFLSTSFFLSFLPFSFLSSESNLLLHFDSPYFFISFLIFPLFLPLSCIYASIIIFSLFPSFLNILTFASFVFYAFTSAFPSLPLYLIPLSFYSFQPFIPFPLIFLSSLFLSLYFLPPSSHFH